MPTERTKFRFNNLGPIVKAELELADFTIISGRNNTGKTYLVYALYGFLQKIPKIAMSSKLCSQFLDDHLTKVAGLSLEGVIERLFDSGRVEWSLDKDAYISTRAGLIEVLTKEYSNLIGPQIFQSSPELFDEVQFGVEFTSNPIITSGFSFKYEVDRKLTIEYSDETVVALLHKDSSDKSSLITSSLVENTHFRRIFKLLYSALLLQSVSELKLSPFILTSARNSISLFNKELTFVRSQASRLYHELRIRGEDELESYVDPVSITSRYPLPIHDNIDFSMNASRLPEIADDHSHNVFSEILSQMIGGYFTNREEDLHFIADSENESEFSIPSHLASSSAWEMSNLYFLLEYYLSGIELLIIDEPESHLDTANQIQLTRLLARLVNNGRKVLITTHSDYIVREVNNLIMLSSPLEDGNKIKRKLGYEENEQLRLDQVQAYVAQNGTLTPCNKDKFGIEMPVFDETIDSLNDRSEELATQIMMKESKG